MPPNRDEVDAEEEEEGELGDRLGDDEDDWFTRLC